jgi:hypothetical protein
MTFALTNPAYAVDEACGRCAGRSDEKCQTFMSTCFAMNGTIDESYTCQVPAGTCGSNGCPGDMVRAGGDCVVTGTGSGTTSGKTPTTPTTPNTTNSSEKTTTTTTGSGNAPVTTTTGSGNAPVTTTTGSGNAGGCDAGTLCNPLKVNSIEELVLTIINVILVFLLPVIILYIMYAGYLFVTAQGNPGEISRARNALLTALIGGVIVLGARAILEVVKGTINAVTNDSAMNISYDHDHV